MLIGNRYRVLDMLGAGGMSVVYRAEDRLGQDMVALKQLRLDRRKRQLDDSKTDGDFLALALEFRALAGLRHPHIVPVLDFGFDATQQPYLTMELIPQARTILEVAAERDQDGKIELLIQVLNALMYLHRRGIVHRDIKPANVLVGADGIARVLDFGLALNTTLSLTGEESGLAGTISYMAPELFQNPVATVQTDLFSVGVMAYEIFTGRQPFEGENIALLMYSIIDSEPDFSGLDSALVGVIGGLLAKTPQARYQSAREVIRDICEATGYPEPLETRSLQESFLYASEFVGREGELELLKQSLSQILPETDYFHTPAEFHVEDAQGSAWLIGGEAGVGKSRLIDELRIRAAMRGVLVLQGRASAEGGQTYHIWRQPMRHLVLSTDVRPEDASVLKEIIPDIDTILASEVPAAAALKGRDHHERLYSSIVSTFRRHRGPVVLILEDLHWAMESLDPLNLLVNQVSELPLLIIGSYRIEEGVDLPARLPGMQLMRLERLSEEGIAQLSTSILGDVGQREELLNLLKRETEGNAFFIVEVIRALAEVSGRLSDIGRITLPDSVLAGGILQVVQRRLTRVPDWARPLLQVAATAGRELDLLLLEQIYLRHAEQMRAGQYRLDQWLTVCSDVTILDVSHGVWQFSHDKLREALLNSLSDEQCRQLHRLVAETIEIIYPGDMSRAEALVEHWHQAGELERELPYVMSVVRHHIDHISGLESARHLILRSLERLPEDDARRAALLVYLSQTYLRVDYGYGERLALKALELAQQHGDERTTAQTLYVLSAQVREQMRYEESEAYNQQSLALFDKLGDPRGSANNLANLGIIKHDLSDYEAAYAYYSQALQIYQDLQDEGRIAFLEVLLGTLARDQKRYDEAVQTIEHGLNIARRIGQISVVSHALNNLGVIATEQGDFARAKDYLMQSLTANRNMGNQWGVTNGYINLGFTHLMLHEDEEARQNLMQGIERALAIRAMNLGLEAVVGIGWLFERQDEDMRAAALVGMAEPLANIDVNRRILPLLARLREKMPAEQLQAGLAQGLDLELETVCHDLLGIMG